MKKYLIIFAAILITATVSAQSNNDYLELTREVLKAEKKAAIADVMKLTEPESQPFWDLYNEYQAAQYLVQNKRIALIKDFAEHYETMSDIKADELWTGALNYQGELLKLKKKYYSKFKKIISPAKAAMFFQAENKIEALVNAQLAVEIPLLETK